MRGFPEPIYFAERARGVSNFPVWRMIFQETGDQGTIAPSLHYAQVRKSF